MRFPAHPQQVVRREPTLLEHCRLCIEPALWDEHCQVKALNVGIKYLERTSRLEATEHDSLVEFNT